MAILGCMHMTSQPYKKFLFDIFSPQGRKTGLFAPVATNFT
jgi:hypothetical protein